MRSDVIERETKSKNGETSDHHSYRGEAGMDPSSQIQLEEIKEADILVGIPSYNNARTIGHVVRAVMAGLAKYFRGARAVIFNSDGGSTDGTQEEVRRVQIEDFKTILASHPVHSIHKMVTPYHGIPGKGSAFRTIFEAAQTLRAKACAVVDSDLRSITPEWIDLLLTPIYEEGQICGNDRSGYPITHLMGREKSQDPFHRSHLDNRHPDRIHGQRAGSSNFCPYCPGHRKNRN